MTLVRDLQVWLKQDAGVQARVRDRVYRGLPNPRAAYPQISLLRVSTIRALDLDLNDPTANARVQLDVWAKQDDEAADVADFLAGLLAAYRGDMNGRRVQAVVPGVQTEAAQEGANAGDNARGRLYRSMLEVVVMADAG